MVRRAPPARRLEALAQARRFRIADGEPDPRGWMVVAADACEVGTVADLIIDNAALEVRYLECRPADNARAVLLPLGFVRLDAAARLVLVDVLTAGELLDRAVLARLPRTAEEEAAIQTVFVGGTSSRVPDG